MVPLSLIYFFKFLGIVVPLLLSVAFLTLLERKVLSIIGLRLGPNKVSVGGFLQPMGDAVKLANKGGNVLSNFSIFFYFLSSYLMLSLSIVLICCLFSVPSPSSIKYSVLFFFLILGFNSFNSMMSGWSTFGKYPLIGSLRTVSQLISYEAVLYVCILSLALVFFSFDFSSFYLFGYIPSFILLIPCVFIWFPTFLAELNRTPYDFSEGESELVSGFNTEYGSLGFTLIFLSEYSNIIFFCLLTGFLFFNGFLFSFLFVILLVLWVRSVLPRFRFDKLMSLAWKFFVPFLTFYFLFLFLFLL